MLKEVERLGQSSQTEFSLRHSAFAWSFHASRSDAKARGKDLELPLFPP